MVAAVAGWLLRVDLFREESWTLPRRFLFLKPTPTHSAAHHWLRVDPGARTEQFMQVCLWPWVSSQMCSPICRRSMSISISQPGYEALSLTGTSLLGRICPENFWAANSSHRARVRTQRNEIEFAPAPTPGRLLSSLTAPSTRHRPADHLFSCTQLASRFDFCGLIRSARKSIF